jgi:cytochrome c-type biogenesis protein CcmH
MSTVRGLFAVALALAGLAAPAALAAEPRTTLPDVEDEVMCPVCGTPLNLAEAPQAEREREFIRGLIAQGLTKEQIKQRLKAEYGSSVLALPEDEGFSLAAYVVPIVVVLGGFVALALTVPRWRRRRTEPVAAAEGGRDPTAAEARRVEEELAGFES